MGLTYQKAGVNIDEGNRFVSQIKPLVKKTRIPGTIGSIGGFAGLFDPNFKKYKKPLLVSATDGVGTKLELAQSLKIHDTVGIDLVAMSVNDLVVTGAKPLFFLDYLATGKLKAREATQVVKGIAKGCIDAGCVLIGGETAEMPGFYPTGAYDLAGFAVGIVEEKKVLPGKVKAGQVLLGLASTGPHSNGYSMIRKVFSKKELKGTLGKRLLAPTQIYVKSILKLIDAVKVHGLVHITGGGFIDNVPRIMPQGLTAHIQDGSWKVPACFNQIQKKGRITHLEMMRTFNMGIGMVVVLDGSSVKKAQALLKRLKIASWVIGDVVKGKKVRLS
jgi:phosphoribosylformylglycinamidine cyclo-ligase